jgi:hypothetical protein
MIDLADFMRRVRVKQKEGRLGGRLSWLVSDINKVTTKVQAYNHTGTYPALREVNNTIEALSGRKQDKYEDELGGLREQIEREMQRWRLVQNDYRVNAGLNDYANCFGTRFTDALAALRPGSRWLDGGAGEAVAMREYFEQVGASSAARCVALGYQKPETRDLTRFEEEHEGRFTYVSGKYFQDMTDEDLDIESRPRDLFDIISDYNGVLLYTRTLSEDLAKYLSLLKPNGILFTCSIWGYVKAPWDGDLDAIDWVKRIGGIVYQVSGLGALVIEKKGSDSYHVPPLRLVDSKFDKYPPQRWFRL